MRAMAVQPALSETKEVVGYVRVERDNVRGCRSVRTIKSFWPGEVVLREKPILSSNTDGLHDYIIAFSKLDETNRNVVISGTFTQFEIDDMHVDVDSETLNNALQMAHKHGVVTDPTTARLALQRCLAAAPVDKLHFYARASTLRHSCLADVSFEFLSGMGTVTARCNIPPQRFVGMWMLQDTSLWWKGANVRSAALRKAGLVSQDACLCERCQGDDTCRAIRCPGCLDFQKRFDSARILMLLCSSAVLCAAFVGWSRIASRGATTSRHGEVSRNGKLKRWRCNVCDFNTSDTVVEGYINIELKLVRDLSDIRQMPLPMLLEQVDVVRSRIGMQHWLAASFHFELVRRCLEEGGPGMTYSGCLSSLRLAEWFSSRKLASPPQPVIDKIAEIMFNTLTFMGEHLLGVRDLRVAYLRAVDLLRGLFEQIDKKLLDRFKAFAGTAQNIRRRCGFCQKMLKGSYVKEVDISADDFGTDEKICTKCDTLSYCNMSCQASDWPRHSYYCFSVDLDFHSEKVGNIFGE